MKPIIISIVSLAIMAGIFSCSKKTSSPGPMAGYWTFNGVKDTAISTVGDTFSGHTLSASTSAATNPNETLTFTFATYPPAAGSYSVIYNGITPTGNNVGVGLTYGLTNYWSTGNDHATANVSFSSSGKVTVALSSVEVQAVTAASPDSGAVTNITVTQQ